MFDFPNTPADGQIYAPPGGPTYQWTASGSAWNVRVNPLAAFKLPEYIFPEEVGYDLDVLSEANDALFVEFLRQCVVQRRIGKVPGGDYNIGTAYFSATDDLNVELSPDARFVSPVTQQLFTGTGQTQFTITAFWPRASSINVESVSSGGVKTLLTVGTQYTYDPATRKVTKTAALTSGETLRVSGADAMIVLRTEATGPTAPRLSWIGGTYDNSQRAYVRSASSGSCITIQNFSHVDLRGGVYKCLDDYVQSQAAGVGDSGVSVTGITSAFIEGNVFIGQPDYGVYASGQGAGTALHFGRVIVTNNIAEKCANGFGVRRWANIGIVTNNIVRDAETGILLTLATDVYPPEQSIVIGNSMQRITNTGIEIQIEQHGFICAGNTITDLGYKFDGTTLTTPSAAAIRVYGSNYGAITGNSIGLRDWVKADQYGIRFNGLSHLGSPTYKCTGNRVTGNIFFNIGTGISEGNFAAQVGNAYTNNSMHLVTTPLSLQTGSSSRWSWFDVATSEMSSGKGTALYADAWTPVMSLTVIGDFTNTVQQGCYEQSADGKEITAHFSVTGSIVHAGATEEFRIKGLPFAAAPAGGGNGHGMLGFVGTNGITFPVGALPCIEVPAGQSYMRVRLNGTPNRLLLASDVASGVSFRFDGTVIYRIA